MLTQDSSVNVTDGAGCVLVAGQQVAAWYVALCTVHVRRVAPHLSHIALVRDAAVARGVTTFAILRAKGIVFFDVTFPIQGY